MMRLRRIQDLVREGLYYLTEHADNEAMADEFDIYDVEHAILTGRIRKRWPREAKCEIVGAALDGRSLAAVVRVTPGGKVRVITVFERHGR